jgi:pimeloyl-ACP methyl ester carboxylesterase
MGVKALESVFGYAMRERVLLQKLAVKLYLINVDYMPTNEQPLKDYAASGYHLVHMPGTSHYPMIENPQLFNQLLKEVIADIEASA